MAREAVDELNGLFEIMREGHPTTPTDDIHRLLGCLPTSVTTYAERVSATGE